METIRFASNRDVRSLSSITGDLLGTRFNACGPQIIRLGEVTATLPSDADPKDLDRWTVGEGRLYDDKPGEGDGIRLGAERMFQGLTTELGTGDRDLLILLHGFARDFGDTVRLAASLQHLYARWRAMAAVLLFSWPSDGRATGPRRSVSVRQDAAASGLAMARALDRLVRMLRDARVSRRDAGSTGVVPAPGDCGDCGQRIHLLAHATGAAALRHALTAFAGMNRGVVPRVIDHCFLMAPDADADALGDPQNLGRLTELANRVHVYHLRNDIAPAASDPARGNADRLGAFGPARPATLDERVTTIDCADVDAVPGPGDGTHLYYRLRDEVISDVAATLRGVSPVRDTRVPLRPGRAWRLQDGIVAPAGGRAPDANA